MITVITVLRREPLTGLRLDNPFERSADREFENGVKLLEWLKKEYNIYSFGECYNVKELEGYKWAVYNYRTNYQHEHPEYNQAEYELRVLIKEVEE